MSEKFRRYRKLEGDLHAKIEVCYSIGGRNFFDGSMERRGIYIFFTTVEKGKCCESYRPMSSKNFKILAVELNRFSNKKQQMIVDWVQAHKDELFDLYVKQDKTRLFKLVTGTDFTGEKKKQFMKKHDQLVDQHDAGQLSDDDFYRAEKELEQKFDIFEYSKQRP